MELLALLSQQISQLPVQAAKAIAQWPVQMTLQAHIQAVTPKEVTLSVPHQPNVKLPLQLVPDLKGLPLQTKIELELVSKEPQLQIKLHSVSKPKAQEPILVKQNLDVQLVKQKTSPDMHPLNIKPGQTIKLDKVSFFAEKPVQQSQQLTSSKQIFTGEYKIDSTTNKPVIDSSSGRFLILNDKGLPKQNLPIQAIVSLENKGVQALSVQKIPKIVQQNEAVLKAANIELQTAPQPAVQQNAFQIRHPVDLLLNFYKMVALSKQPTEGQGIANQLIQRDQPLLDQIFRMFANEQTEAKQDLPNWRLYSIPVMIDEQLEPIYFYQKKKERQQAEDQNRFLVECSFSAYGNIQIDGFFKGKTLHVKLRSHVEFQSIDKSNLLETYTNLLEQFSIKGKLSFEVYKDFPKPYFEDMKP